MLWYGSFRNWYPSLSPHFCLLSFTKTPNCFFCHPCSNYQRNLLTPTSDDIPPLLWTIWWLPSHNLPLSTARRPAPSCPLFTLLRHAGLPAVPPTCQVSSLLRTLCLRPPPPGDCVAATFMSLRPREAPAPQGGQDITFFVTSSP